MKLLGITLTALLALAVTCLLAFIVVYVLITFAVARTVRAEMPAPIGDLAANRIENWVLGTPESDTIESADPFGAQATLPPGTWPTPPGGTVMPPVTITVIPREDCGVPIGLPVTGPIVSWFGWRDLTDPDGVCHVGSTTCEFHAGLDISIVVNQPVYATMCGKVLYAGDSKLYGNHVVLRNGIYTTLYAHLNTISVAQDSEVELGQIVGFSGCTGRCFGPHVHYGLAINGAFVDPLTNP